MEGRLRGGREHGEWTSYARDGQPVATGSYAAGQRHGWWTLTDPSTGDEQRIYYARGLPIPDVQSHVDRLTAGIRSDNPAVRISAVLALGRLGPIGAGPLSDVLGDVLDDADEETVVLVLRTLGGMGDDAVSALPAIRRRQTDDSSPIRLQARLAAFSIDADSRERERERLLAAVERLSPAAALDAMAQIFALDIRRVRRWSGN
jgi:HEAT repeat protein